MKKIILLSLLILLLSACREPLKEVSLYDDKLNHEDFKSFGVELNCDKAHVTELKKSFVDAYCEFMLKQLSLSIQDEFPDWEQNKKPDLLLKATLEQVYGGSEALRLFPSFEAGRSMLTINFSFYQKNQKIAQRRLTEISRMMNIKAKVFNNEEVIYHDSISLAKDIAQYIHNPVKFDQQLKKQRDGYEPH